MMRILIVKIGALGDVAMALSLIPAIKGRYPKSHITWLTGKGPEALLKGIPEIDHLLVMNDHGLLAGSYLKKSLALLSAWRLLRKQKVDLLITAHVDPRYRWLSLWVWAKQHKYFKKNKGRQIPVPGRFHGQEYVRLLSSEDSCMDHPIPSYLYHKDSHISPHAMTIAIAPGGNDFIEPGKNLRRWPIEHYKILVDKLVQEGFKVILFGGKEDHWVEDYFPQIKSYIGITTVLETIELMKQVSLLITHDSGPLHLARLAGCKILGLFGPTIPHEKMQKNEHEQWIWGGKHLACRPCYDGRFYAQCKKNICMESITPEEVYMAACKLIGDLSESCARS